MDLSKSLRNLFRKRSPQPGDGGESSKLEEDVASALRRRQTAKTLPELAPRDADVVGRLSFTVLAKPARGAAGETALKRAIAEFETAFRERLLAGQTTEVQLGDDRDEPFASIRITYAVRAGEDRMAVGQYFQEICRDHGLL